MQNQKKNVSHVLVEERLMVVVVMTTRPTVSGALKEKQLPMVKPAKNVRRGSLMMRPMEPNVKTVRTERLVPKERRQQHALNVLRGKNQLQVKIVRIVVQENIRILKSKKPVRFAVLMDKHLTQQKMLVLSVL